MILCGLPASPSFALGTEKSPPFPVKPTPQNRVTEVAALVLDQQITVAPGTGVVRGTARRNVENSSLLCRLNVTLKLGVMVEGGEGAISMARNNNTCIQVLVSRSGNNVVVDYLTLLGSQRKTYSRGEEIRLDIVNFAQKELKAKSEEALSVKVEGALKGAEVRVGGGTGLYSATADTRELKLHATGPPTLSQGGVMIKIERSGNWKGSSGSVRVALTKPDSDQVVFDDTLPLEGRAGTSEVGLDVSDVPPGEYILSASSAAFNSPSIVRSVRIEGTSPSTLLLLFGLLLVLMSTGLALFRAGILGRMVLAGLASAALVGVALLSFSLLNGRAVVDRLPSRTVNVEDQASPAPPPPGSLDAQIDSHVQERTRAGDFSLYGFMLPNLGGEEAGSPVTFRPM